MGAIEKKIIPSSSPTQPKQPKFQLPIVVGTEPFAGAKNLVKRDFKDWEDLSSVGKAICLCSPMGAGKTEMTLEGCRGRNSIIISYRCGLAEETYANLLKRGIDAVLYSDVKGPIRMPLDKPYTLVITPDSFARIDPSAGWAVKHFLLDEFTFAANQQGGFIPGKILKKMEREGTEPLENPTELIWDMVRKVESVVFVDAMLTNTHLDLITKHRPDIVPVVMDRKGIQARGTYIEGLSKFLRVLKKKLAEEISAGRSLSFCSNTKKILIELFEEYKNQDIRICLITADGFQTNRDFKPASYKEAAGWAQFLLTSPKISAGNSYVNGEGESNYKVHFGLASPQSTPGEDFVQSLARNRSIKEVYVSVTNRPGCWQSLPVWTQTIEQVREWACKTKEEMSKYGIKFSRFDGEILNGDQADMTFLYMLRKHMSQTKNKYLKVILPLMKRNGMEIVEVITEGEEEKVNLKEQREIRTEHEVEKLAKVNLEEFGPMLQTAREVEIIAKQRKEGKVSPLSKYFEEAAEETKEQEEPEYQTDPRLAEELKKKTERLDQLKQEPEADEQEMKALKGEIDSLVKEIFFTVRENKKQRFLPREVAEEAVKNGWLKKKKVLDEILLSEGRSNVESKSELVRQLMTLDIIQRSTYIKNIHSARQCLPAGFNVNKAKGVTLDLSKFATAPEERKKAALFFKAAGLKVQPETGLIVDNIWEQPKREAV